MKFAALFVVLVLLSSCGHNILLKHNHRYYTEFSKRLLISEQGLEHSVVYNVPNMVDEENWKTLTIYFTDSTAALKKKHLTLPANSDLVKCSYHSSSIWHMGEAIPLTGSIHVLNWQPAAVTLRLNLHGYDARLKHKIYYQGKRAFTYK